MSTVPISTGRTWEETCKCSFEPTNYQAKKKFFNILWIVRCKTLKGKEQERERGCIVTVFSIVTVLHFFIWNNPISKFNIRKTNKNKSNQRMSQGLFCNNGTKQFKIRKGLLFGKQTLRRPSLSCVLSQTRLKLPLGPVVWAALELHPGHCIGQTSGIRQLPSSLSRHAVSR